MKGYLFMMGFAPIGYPRRGPRWRCAGIERENIYAVALERWIGCDPIVPAAGRHRLGRGLQTPGTQQ
jgi:hypothetical protein